MSDKCIVWFRQDLRIRDNLTLQYCKERNVRILPIFIFDPDIDIGSCSKYWLFHSLKSLNQSLNDSLRIFCGNTCEILEKLLETGEYQEISWNKMYDEKSLKIENQINKISIKHGVKSFIYNSSLILNPSETLKKDGTPYRVFTPFYKQNYFNIKFPTNNLKTKDLKIISSSSKKTHIDSIKDFMITAKPNWTKKFDGIWEHGENSAEKKLNDFLNTGINNYDEGRNRPDKLNTSRLSPHIHFGEISVVRIASCLNLNNKDHERFYSELVWREFSYNLLFFNKQLPRNNLQTKFDTFPWINNKTELKKWQLGQTGYPIIDAGMRELWQTGYMHNRVRMIVGSFLVKNLMIHWKYGLQWFWDTLMDADIASNSASWQWVAGTGADAAPYFRIFNPVTQSKKFDPDAEYIRKYVPELKNIPNKYIHLPNELDENILNEYGVKLGSDYPHPIVDLSATRQRALTAFQKISKTTS